MKSQWLRTMRTTTGAAVALLLITCLLNAQTRRVSSGKNDKGVGTQKATPASALPASIALANGTSIPVGELVPRTEAAITQLTEIVSRANDLELEHTESALATLANTVSGSMEPAKRAIGFAGSPLQLTEIRLNWDRMRVQLESVSDRLTRVTSRIDEQQKKLSKIHEEWNGAEKAAAAKVPRAFVQRLETVHTLTVKAETDLGAATERILKMQVESSQVRAQITDVSTQLDLAESVLREQIFVLDAPPIWVAWQELSIPRTWEHITSAVDVQWSRCNAFVRANKSKLLVYFICHLFLFVLLFHLSRQGRPAWFAEKEAAAELLLHPGWVTLFLMLALLTFVFKNAPGEGKALARILMCAPTIVLALRALKRTLHRPVVALCAFYALNVTTLQLVSGTPTRRVVVLLITATMLAGCIVLLRRIGTTRVVSEARLYGVVRLGGYATAVTLAISTVCNIVGNVSFADVLASGMILTAYTAVACYVLYTILSGMTYAITASSLGQTSCAIRVNRVQVNRTVLGYLKVASWILWSLAALWAFHVSSQAFQQARDIIRREWRLGVVSISLLDGVLFVLVLYVSTVIAKLIRFFLTEEIFPRTHIDSGSAQASSRLVHIALLIAGTFLAFGAAGVELSKLTVLTGAFGVGLGFGLQNVVSNFVCGIIVSLERPVQIGNIIDVGNLSGEVSAIGFRASTIRTFDGADVIVPNSDLVTKSVVNWSLTDYDRRSDIRIGAAYGTDPVRVLAILERIVTAHPDVKDVPAPLITFDEVGESAFKFAVRFWTRLDRSLQVRSDLNTGIIREFEREHIEIPFPQREIHVHKDSAAVLDAPHAPSQFRVAGKS